MESSIDELEAMQLTTAEIMLLKMEKRLSHRVIAEGLDVSKARVGQRIKRAKEKLEAQRG